MEFIRREVEGERFTPTRLVSRLKEQLTAYIESAYPLNDPVLVRSRRKLLEEAAGGHLSAQEPYVETTPRYKSHDGDYSTLGLKPHIADLFTKLTKLPRQFSTDDDPVPLLFPKMYTHQAQAIRTFLVEGKEIIVATGTARERQNVF